MGNCCQSQKNENDDNNNIVGLSNRSAGTVGDKDDPAMEEFRVMIRNKDMSFFIDAKWSEKGLNRIGHLIEGEAKDFLEEVLRYAS